MNRDEKRARVAGRPPALQVTAGRQVLCPSEPTGGTWIALNESGASFALVNWYSVPGKMTASSVSRGIVVAAVAHLTNPGTVTNALREMPLSRVNPFRLVGIFPQDQLAVEWRWNLSSLDCEDRGWSTRQWISSGFDELTAQRLRSEEFRRLQRQPKAGNLDWLRQLHRSHANGPGPFSTCMHREDAATVSYTEVSVSDRAATMAHWVGPPCQSTSCTLHQLELR